MNSQTDQLKKVHYLSSYKRIKRRILFHARYTFLLGIWYQVLRYSIPIVSGSLAAVVGTHQLPSETVVIWTSIVITFLGTINSVIRPSESYNWTVIFASQFAKFLDDFDLKFNEMREEEEQKIIEFLKIQNQELTNLIDRFNKPPKRENFHDGNK